jgi:hypothetical protein
MINPADLSGKPGQAQEGVGAEPGLWAHAEPAPIGHPPS